MRQKSISRSILSLLLAVLLVCASLQMGVLASTGAEKADTASDIIKLDPTSEKTAPLGDSGTIKIATLKDLEALRDRVNGGDALVGQKVELTNNIQGAGDWVPIGTSLKTPFSGEFIGKGYTLSGFKVESEVEGGLFGYLEDATLSDFTLKDITAPKSTSGLFYHALRSSVAKVSYEEGINKTPMGFSLRGGMPSTPSGTPNYSWYSVGPKVFEISTADQLIGFGQLVNGTTGDINYPSPIDFSGVTIKLMVDIDLTGHAWVPIGTISDIFEPNHDYGNPFSGVFEGNNHQIINLTYNNSGSTRDFGFFLYTKGASLINLIFVEPNITIVNGDAATLAVFASGTTIDSIRVYKPKIDVSGTCYFDNPVTIGTITRPATGAGIVSFFNIEGPPTATYHNKGYDLPTVGEATLQNCFVYEPKFSSSGTGGYGDLAGIVTDNTNYGIYQNVVYGGSIATGSGGKAAGIASFEEGPMRSFTAVGQNLVFGTDFDGEATGILGGYFSYSSVVDNIITGITHAGNAGDLVLATRIIPGTSSISYVDENIFGGLRHFTDMTGNFNMHGVVTGSEEEALVRDNFWDDVGTSDEPLNGTRGNLALSTHLLTGGDWVPSPDYWVGMANYYPQITALNRSTFGEVQYASGLSAVALIPADPLEKYTTGVGELHLMNNLPIEGKNVAIKWDFQGVALGDIKYDKRLSQDYGVLTYEKDVHLPAFNMTATVTTNEGYGPMTFVKHFKDVQLVDSLLTMESYTPSQNQVVDTTKIIQVVFKDAIEENPDLASTIDLYVREEGMAATNNGQLEQSIIGANAADASFVVNPSTKTVDLTFTLRDDTHYRVIIPSGMIREVAAVAGQTYVKKNFNEPLIIDFKTPVKGAPVIQLTTEFWKGQTTKPLTLKELTDSFSVLESVNGPLLYDKNNTTHLTPYTGNLWDGKDPRGSMQKVLDGATGPVVYYYLDNQSVIGSAPNIGKGRLYIMAKNANQLTDRRIMDINIIGQPDWTSPKPEPGVHLPWTKELKTVLDAAKQGATAGIVKADGSVTPVVVEVVYDPLQWERVLKQIDHGPQMLVTRVVAYDSYGAEALNVSVFVYLDKPLMWDMTPSPVTMNYTTKKRVEERMNVVAKTFPNDIIKYKHFMEDKYWGENKDHWPGSYRQAGMYYVDVTSDPQWVTMCTNPYDKCTVKGDHPYERVKDSFILEIRRTPDEDTGSYWGKKVETLLGGEYLPDTLYSREIVDLKPTSYNLPVSILEALVQQKYGKIRVAYEDTYRWNLYSDTLDNRYKWGDEYSLQTFLVASNEVAGLVGSQKEGIQFVFEQQGRLFGTVAFDLNLNKLGSTYTGLPKDNLGLYAYNMQSKALELISPVFVTEDNWASADLTELRPTVYVLKELDLEDQVVKPLDSFTPFYTTTRFKGEYGEWIQAVDSNPEYLSERKSLVEMHEIIAGEPSSKLYFGSPSGPALTLVVVAFLLVGGFAALVLYKKHRKEGEENG